MKGKQRFSRQHFQKHKLFNYKQSGQLSFFDESFTESQNMFENNYHKVWDCGNVAYSQLLGEDH